MGVLQAGGPHKPYVDAEALVFPSEKGITGIPRQCSICSFASLRLYQPYAFGALEQIVLRESPVIALNFVLTSEIYFLAVPSNESENEHKTLGILERCITGHS